MAFTKVTDNLLSSGVGTGAGNILELDSSGKLPAVDGSLLTNIPHGVDGITSSAGSSTGIRIFSGGGVVIGDTSVLTTTHGSMLVVDGDETMSGGITIGTTNTGAANGNIAALAFSPIGFSMGRRRAAIWAVSKSEGSSVGYAADLCLGAYGAADGSSISTSHERLRILSSGGITFNSDTAAANALDDYEEGTFTATMVCGTSGTITLHSAIRTLAYVKIGKMVTITGNIYASSVSSPTGALSITGLPFTNGSGNHSRSAISVRWEDLLSSANTTLQGNIHTSSTSIQLSRFTTGAVVEMAGDVRAGSNVRIGGTYFTDS